MEVTAVVVRCPMRSHGTHVIDVILPALNEEHALPPLLAAFPDGYRAIVVDNGSTDGTARVAAAAGALVVYEPLRGFGAACAAGPSARKKSSGLNW